MAVPPRASSSRFGDRGDDVVPASDWLLRIARGLGCGNCCKVLIDKSNEIAFSATGASFASAGFERSALPIPMRPNSAVLPNADPENVDPTREQCSAGLPEPSNAVWRPMVTFRDGRTYEGQWKGNHRHGEGKEVSRDGDFVYEGQFRNDLYHGFGKMTWSNGSKYIGNCRDNKKHGWGHEFYPHGESYQGYFGQGAVDGYGSYFFKDGTAISGLWKNGRLVYPAGLEGGATAEGVGDSERLSDGPLLHPTL